MAPASPVRRCQLRDGAHPQNAMLVLSMPAPAHCHSCVGPACRVRAAGFASGRFGGMPAAARAVARLPVPETTVTAGGAGEETYCVVCLEGCAAGDALRTVPCAHTFHEDASWTGSPSAASARWRRRTPPANTHRRQAWDR